jgi:hypothetical protein
MAEPKTQRTKASVAAFISGVEDDTRRKDAKAVDKMMRAITGEKPAMWGPTIIGYGEWETPSGMWPRLGFSPRKANLVLYVIGDFKECTPLLKKLGKHKTGKSCLYLKRLSDVDRPTLETLIANSVQAMASQRIDK